MQGSPPLYGFVYNWDIKKANNTQHWCKSSFFLTILNRKSQKKVAEENKKQKQGGSKAGIPNPIGSQVGRPQIAPENRTIAQKIRPISADTLAIRSKTRRRFHK